MNVRTLPVSVRPMPGESFHSLMVRLAARNDAPLLTVLAATGFADQAHFRTLTRAYGVTADPQRLECLAHAMRLPSTQIRATLLIAFNGVCLRAPELLDPRPDVLRKIAMREWMYSAGSHVCPECLDEDGYWRLAWKLPWSFACLRHRRLLVSFCEGCARRTQSGRQDGSTIPVLPSVVPDIRVCHNPLPPGIGVSGRKEVCGFDLTLSDAARIGRHRAMIEAQQEIDAHLHGPPGEGQLAYFNRLRSLAACLLAGGQRKLLGPLPGLAETAWLQHEAERAGTLSQRSAMRERGQDGRRAPRQRVWVGPAVNAALLAAVLPSAVRISASPELVADLAHDTHDLRPRHAASFAAWFHMPDDLAEAWHRALRRRSPRIKQQLKLNPAAPQFDVRFVPRLWPEPLYEAEIAPLVANTRLLARTARAYTSLAVARYLINATWPEAGAALGYSDMRAVRVLANNAVTRLAEAGARESFHAALSAALDGLIKQPAVDYRQREADLAHWNGFTPEEWARIAFDAGIRVGKGRDRHAAAWLWAQLTGLDWREAPIYGGHPTETDRELFRRFTRDVLPAVEGSLLTFGENLLNDLSETDAL
ncbi:MAG: TniQ family protein [Solirubrobacteraceae bacterium]